MLKTFEKKIKSVQSNWGREYHGLLPLLKQLGYTFRYPCPHIHQQNGKAERKHLHIVWVVLSLLAQAQMALRIWWDAFVSSVYLINILPSALT